MPTGSRESVAASCTLWAPSRNVPLVSVGCQHLAEQVGEHGLGLPRLLYGRGRLGIGGFADTDQRHHPHGVVRRALHPVDALRSHGDDVLLVELALGRLDPSGSMPLMVSMLCPLSVGTKRIVSPGAAAIRSGTNTIEPFSPLFSMRTWI